MLIRDDRIRPGADLSQRDLRGYNLRNRNLAGVWLEGANLAGVDLYGANLTGAVLVRANLARANLRCANLVGVSAFHANLADADLSWANLKGATFQEADLRGADFNFAMTECLRLPGAKLTGISNYARSPQIFLELVRQLNLELSATDWQIFGHVLAKNWCWDAIIKHYQRPPVVLKKLREAGYGEFLDLWTLHKKREQIFHGGNSKSYIGRR